MATAVDENGDGLISDEEFANSQNSIKAALAVEEDED